LPEVGADGEVEDDIDGEVSDLTGVGKGTEKHVGVLFVSPCGGVLESNVQHFHWRHTSNEYYNNGYHGDSNTVACAVCIRT